MKALSLWQPWATLVAIGAKEYETRSWATTYRGPLVIHAARRPDEAAALERAIQTADLPVMCPFIEYAVKVYAARPFTLPLPLGAALCIVDLVSVVNVELIRDLISNQEYAFGDYAPGRYAWKFENVRQFICPIAMHGRQRIFDCPDIEHWLEGRQ
jgi:hypothetical protein